MRKERWMKGVIAVVLIAALAVLAYCKPTRSAIGGRGENAKGEAPLPPGARWVEYLESTGTQYIDTGIQFRGVNPVVEVRMMATKNEDRDQIATSQGSIFRVNFNTQSNACYYRYYDTTARTWAFSGMPLNGNWHTFFFSNKCLVDGVETYSMAGDFDFSNVGMSNIKLFAGRNYANLRIAYCRIIDGGLVRDFRPIAIGDKGYMLDLVSGEYLPYGNKGTGEFVIGPDKK